MSYYNGIWIGDGRDERAKMLGIDVDLLHNFDEAVGAFGRLGYTFNKRATEPISYGSNINQVLLFTTPPAEGKPGKAVGIKCRRHMIELFAFYKSIEDSAIVDKNTPQHMIEMFAVLAVKRAIDGHLI